MVFGLTCSAPAVTASIFSISALPYEGPFFMKWRTSIGRMSRLRSSPVNGSRSPEARSRGSARTSSECAASRASDTRVVRATASRVARRVALRLAGGDIGDHGGTRWQDAGDGSAGRHLDRALDRPGRADRLHGRPRASGDRRRRGGARRRTGHARERPAVAGVERTGGPGGGVYGRQRVRARGGRRGGELARGGGYRLARPGG